MSQSIQRRRGTTAQHSTFTGALAEITVDTDKKTAVVHDGATVGGNPLLDAKTYDPLNERKDAFDLSTHLSRDQIIAVETGRRTELHDVGGPDDFSGYEAGNGSIFKIVGRQSNAKGTPFLAAVRNDLAPNSIAYPTAVAGIAFVDESGNQAFGGFFKTISFATTGSTPGAEINIFNESGVPPTDTFYPDKSFTSTDQWPVGLKVAAGGDTAGAVNSAVGIMVGREGGSTVGYDTGIFIENWGARKKGIVVQSENTDVRHLVLIDSLPGVTVGPQADFFKDAGKGGTGNANDGLGRLSFSGNNSVGERIVAARLDVQMPSVADGIESGIFALSLMNNGVLARQVTIGAGLAVGTSASNTGGGRVNAQFALDVAGLQVIGPRIAGWGDPTGSTVRTTFDTATVTLEGLAQRVGQLVKDMKQHGLISS